MLLLIKRISTGQQEVIRVNSLHDVPTTMLGGTLRRIKGLVEDDGDTGLIDLNENTVEILPEP